MSPARLRRATPANKPQPKRPLDSAETGQLLRVVEGHGGRHETITAFRLMWLTLCRPSEAVEARWAEFDLDGAIWRIPAERMKKRKEHAMPLPTQAIEMLRALHGLTGRHAHLFPHRDDRTKPMVGASLRTMLNALGWGKKYSPHATRTTGSTRLNELGLASDWIARQLAHAEPNAVRRTYNHAEYLGDRAKMMQQWADMLDSWEAGATVTPIKSNAGHEGEFEAVLKDLAAQVKQNEPGCLLYDLFKSKKASTYVVMEQYASGEALAAHGKTAHYMAAGPKLGAVLDGRPQIDILQKA